MIDRRNNFNYIEGFNSNPFLASYGFDSQDQYDDFRIFDRRFSEASLDQKKKYRLDESVYRYYDNILKNGGALNSKQMNYYQSMQGLYK